MCLYLLPQVGTFRMQNYQSYGLMQKLIISMTYSENYLLPKYATVVLLYEKKKHHWKHSLTRTAFLLLGLRVACIFCVVMTTEYDFLICCASVHFPVSGRNTTDNDPLHNPRVPTYQLASFLSPSNSLTISAV